MYRVNSLVGCLFNELDESALELPIHIRNFLLLLLVFIITICIVVIADTCDLRVRLL